MSKWTIGKKLISGVMGLAACLVALGIASLWAVNGLHDDLTEISEKILRKSELSGSMQVTTWTIRAELRATLLATALKRPQDIDNARNNAEQAFTRLEAYLEQIRPLLIDEKAQAAAARIASILPQWRDAFREIAALAANGKVDAAYKVRAEKEGPLASQMEEAVGGIHEVQQAVAAATLAVANQRALSNKWLIAGIISVGLLFGLLAFLMVRNLVATLRATVKELSSGGDQVASASGQIATTSQTLSQGASEQAASVEEISSSMEEMTAMTRSSGANSSEAMSMMLETAQQVERSNAALSEMVVSMSSIKSSSERVAKINKTIDEIAFQTNILALNAAVEAARAGEAGMGFAVVADEVRNLAQRAAGAAKDTAALIEESIANSNQGAEKLELVSTAIRGITEGAQKVKQLIGEVNEAAKQQVQGIQQVSTAIQQVNTVTQNNAANAEESAAAAEELSAQSMTVRELVGQLGRMVDGDRAARPDQGHPADRPLARSAAARPLNHAAPASVKSNPKHAEDSFPMEPAEPGTFRSF